MIKGLLWFNFFILSLGLSGAWYIVNNIDPTEGGIFIPWILVGAITLTLWAILAYLGYGLRLLFPVNRQQQNQHFVLIRSERQALLLSILIGLQLILQGFLLWNIFSGILLVGVIFVLEVFFMSQESRK